MKSRRQFIHGTVWVLATACCSCRDQNRSSTSATESPLQQGTNAAAKYPDNVVGRFYVTDACIDCDLCKEAVPAVFARNDTAGHAYVRKQPTGDAELRDCLDVVEGCPVEAIVDTLTKV